MNELDNNIKFTLEMEEVLNFCDVKIRKSDAITIMMCRKSTNAYHINPKCKTLKSYKWTALRTYVSRAIDICSNKELREEIRTIKTIAKTADI